MVKEGGMCGKGGVHGKRGACMVKGGMHGKGGVHGKGVCMVKWGGMHGERGGMRGMYHPPPPHKIWLVIAWAVHILLECILV